MLEFLSGFDALGLGTLVGSLLFLGALIWVLVENRTFDQLNQRGAAADAQPAGEEASGRSTAVESVPVEEVPGNPEPPRPHPGRRVA